MDIPSPESKRETQRERARKTGNFGKDSMNDMKSTMQDYDDEEDMSDEGDANANLKMTTSQIKIQEEQKQQRRWGKVVQEKSYNPGSVTRILALIAAVIFIPLQLFCDGYVKIQEQKLI